MHSTVEGVGDTLESAAYMGHVARWRQFGRCDVAGIRLLVLQCILLTGSDWWSLDPA
jgi:hypothetical protein